MRCFRLCLLTSICPVRIAGTWQIKDTNLDRRAYWNKYITISATNQILAYFTTVLSSIHFLSFNSFLFVSYNIYGYFFSFKQISTLFTTKYHFWWYFSFIIRIFEFIRNLLLFFLFLLRPWNLCALWTQLADIIKYSFFFFKTECLLGSTFNYLERERGNLFLISRLALHQNGFFFTTAPVICVFLH